MSDEVKLSWEEASKLIVENPGSIVRQLNEDIRYWYEGSQLMWEVPNRVKEATRWWTYEKEIRYLIVFDTRTPLPNLELATLTAGQAIDAMGEGKMVKGVDGGIFRKTPESTYGYQTLDVSTNEWSSAITNFMLGLGAPFTIYEEPIEQWTPTSMEEALRQRFVDGRTIKIVHPNTGREDIYGEDANAVSITKVRCDATWFVKK